MFRPIVHALCILACRERNAGMTADESKCPETSRVRVSTGSSTMRCNALLLASEALLHTCVHYNPGHLCSPAGILVQCIPVLLQVSLLPRIKAVKSEEVQTRTVSCRYCRTRFSHSRYIGVCTPCGNSLLIQRHRNAESRRKNTSRAK